MVLSRIFKSQNLAIASRYFSVLQPLFPVGESAGFCDVHRVHLHAESLNLKSEVCGHEEALKRLLDKMVTLGEGTMAGHS